MKGLAYMLPISDLIYSAFCGGIDTFSYCRSEHFALIKSKRGVSKVHQVISWYRVTMDYYLEVTIVTSQGHTLNKTPYSVL